jgi:hypothetical protein
MENYIHMCFECDTGETLQGTFQQVFVECDTDGT